MEVSQTRGILILRNSSLRTHPLHCIHLQNRLLDPLADLFFRPLIRTPRQGADTAIHLMFDADKEGLTGTFCRSNKIVELGDKYVHHKHMQTLWDETEKIVQDYLK